MIPNSRIVLPGPGRITLALLAIVPAAMAAPYQTTTERWVLGVAVAIVILLFASWRGRYLTTWVRLRLAMLRRRDAAGERESAGQHGPTCVRRRCCGSSMSPPTAYRW